MDTTFLQSSLSAIAERAEQLTPDRSPVAHRVVTPHAIVEVRVTWRYTPNILTPDACTQAILELLYRRGRVRYCELIDALNDRHSETAVRVRLARLRRRGEVVRSVTAPRGYYLKENVNRETA